MKLNILDEMVGVKRIEPLHYKKIKVRSSDYESFVWPGQMLAQMMSTCLSDDGIGLAAPQIGIFKRVFIIRDFEDLGNLEKTFSVFVNPKWTALRDDGKSTSVEGCLSVPGQCFEVERWVTIDAEWWDWDDLGGTPVKKSARFSGYKARVFQHEFQHLNAISIVDVGTPG